MYGLIMQIDFGQIIHVMTEFGLEDIMCYHGIEEFTSDFNPIVLQNEHVVLYILTDLK